MPQVLVLYLFQSTHPHGVRHARLLRSKAGQQVSIHAPTRGATYQHHLLLKRTNRFNPRTHTGCDISFIKFSKIGSCFNPRTHTGCDVIKNKQGWQTLVSIHAPTRGATNIRHTSYTCSLSFNPRTHTGCDEADYQSTKIDRMFQSTHPHGVRLPN